jgi:hypothetical protein
VLIQQARQGYGRDEAVAATQRLLRERVDGFLRVRAQFTASRAYLDLGYGQRAAVDEYSRTMVDLIAGWADWSTRTRRYHLPAQES